MTDAGTTSEQLIAEIEDLRRRNAKLESLLAESNAARKLAREESSRHRLLFDRLPLPYQSLDANGRFIDANSAWLEAMGYERDEVVGSYFGDYLAQEFRELFPDRFSSFKAAGEVRGVEFDMVRKDGTLLPVAFNGRIGYGEKGEFLQTHCVMRDISARREAYRALAESEAKYRALAEHSNDMILRYDFEDSPGYQYMSPSSARILGYRPEEFYADPELGRRLIHPEDLWQMDKLVSGDVETRTTERWRHKDGHYVWLEMEHVPSWDESGSLARLECVARDVTERVEAEEALRASEERFHRAVMDAPLPAIITAEDGEVLLVNRAWADITGYSPSEINTLDAWVSRAYGESGPGVLAGIKQLYALQNRIHEGEFTLRTASGKERIWDFNTSALGRLPDGRRTIISMAADVTERKQAEARVAKLSRLYQLLSHVNQTVIRIPDRGKLFHEVCRAAVEAGGFLFAWVGLVDEATGRVVPVAGYGVPEDFIGRLKVSVNDEPEGRGVMGTAIREEKCAVSNDMLTEEKMIPWRRQAEEIGARSVGAFPIRVGNKIIGAVTLISRTLGDFGEEEIELLEEMAGDVAFALELHAREKRRAEAEAGLAQSENRFRSVIETSPLGIVLSRAGTILYANPAYIRMTGHEPSENLLGRTTLEFVAPHFRGEVYRRIKSREGGRMIVGAYEAIGQRKDGSFFPYNVHALPIDLPDGPAAVIFFRDLTEQRTVEGALEESEARFRRLAENALDMIFRFELSPRRAFTYVSPASIRLSGYAPEEFYADPDLPFKLMGIAVPESLQEILNLTSIEEPSILHWKHKDGRDVIGEQRNVGIFDAAGNLVAIEGIIRDVTEAKHMEERLMRAQRLETAGRIAGQVAHDFNNLLGPLVAYPELIKMQLPPGDMVAEYCEAMIDSAMQASHLNDDMMALARRGNLHEEHVDLNELVEAAVRQMPPAPASLEVVLSLAPELPPISGTPAQLLRVLANLISNARDAMREEGVLTLGTENLYLDRPLSRFGRIEMGEYVRVTVSDTGCGIPETIRDHIFDAFFSTKSTQRRRGCGLGLTVVHNIVQDHSGYIDMESVEGTGTTFSLYFPARRDLARESPMPRQTPGGRERILVVDDDNLQRKAVTRMLETLGYNVAAVAAGGDAIAHLAENEVDLLVLDMIMPGMDGADTFERARKLRPGIRAIITSGGTESDRVKEVQRAGAGEYLRKPVTVASLASAVRRELERRH